MLVSPVGSFLWSAAGTATPGGRLLPIVSAVHLLFLVVVAFFPLQVRSVAAFLSPSFPVSHLCTIGIHIE